MRVGHGRAAMLVTATWMLIGWWSAMPAAADEPFAVEGLITDRVGALAGREDEVEAAQDRLFDDHRLDLFVVYVDDFAGLSAQEWADQTATRSQLDINQALLAVATSERVYHLSVDAEYPLTDDQLAEIRAEAVTPALRENDWAGAAVGAADGLRATLSGDPVVAPEIVPGDPQPSADGEFPWVPVVLAGGAGVVGVGAFAYARRSRRRRAQAPDAGSLTLDELDARASHLLVETDDAVKTSVQELGFAQAQFGDAAAAPFAAAITDAKEQLAASFRLRQQLDDAVPEDDATRRRMLEEIVSRCESANEALDAQAEAFDRLRALERNLPEVLAEVDKRAAELDGRVARLSGTLGELRARYAETALASVAGNDAEAGERLVFVRTAVADARQKVADGDESGAAVAVLAAQEAVDQARQIADAVDRLAADLDAASDGLRALVQDTIQDLAEARAMQSGGGQSAELASRVAAAEQALVSVQQELSAGPVDPLGATSRLEEANEALDHALQGIRDEHARQQRARAAFDQAILAARSEISATEDFVTTRRGAVGSQARTRLAEAQRHLAQASVLASSDPEGALREAQLAHQLAAQAGQLARSDVDTMTGPGGPLAGGSGRGGGLGGAILGGILIDSILGGGRTGGFGGGFGGSVGGTRGGSRSRGGGGRSPGSFGGRGTRARRGGGGRF